jgi:ectoine hydroxylase-related dioxygenase (phytanoyl-CoA dioxygenase family)
MGAMVYASGTQHHGSFPEVPLSTDSQELFEGIIRKHDIPRVSYSLKAGDAVFHSGNILHSTFGNTSAKRREVLAVIYYADGTLVMEPDNEHRRSDLRQFLPGLKGGDLAAGELNPLLYQATP